MWMDYARVFDRLSFIPTNYPDPVAPHAAHSIYFQVLGDQGFAGLAIFLLILASAWRNASVVVRATRDREEWHWARGSRVKFAVQSRRLYSFGRCAEHGLF